MSKARICGWRNILHTLIHRADNTCTASRLLDVQKALQHKLASSDILLHHPARRRLHDIDHGFFWWKTGWISAGLGTFIEKSVEDVHLYALTLLIPAPTEEEHDPSQERSYVPGLNSTPCCWISLDYLLTQSFVQSASCSKGESGGDPREN